MSIGEWPGRGPPGPSHAHSQLLTDAETADKLGVAVRVLAFEVIEQSPSLANQLQKAAARVVVLCVNLEMLGEIVDALAEERDLNFRGSRVAVVCAVRADDSSLAIFGKRHISSTNGSELTPQSGSTEPPYCR